MLTGLHENCYIYSYLSVSEVCADRKDEEDTTDLYGVYSAGSIGVFLP